MQNRMRRLEAIDSPRNDQIEEADLLRRQLALYKDRLHQFEDVSARSHQLEKIAVELWYNFQEMLAKSPAGPEASQLIHKLLQLTEELQPLIAEVVETARVDTQIVTQGSLSS